MICSGSSSRSEALKAGAGKRLVLNRVPVRFLKGAVLC